MKSPEKFGAAYSSGIRSSPVPYDAGDNFMGSFRTTLNERLNGLERVDETSSELYKGYDDNSESTARIHNDLAPGRYPTTYITNDIKLPSTKTIKTFKTIKTLTALPSAGNGTLQNIEHDVRVGEKMRSLKIGILIAILCVFANAQGSMLAPQRPFTYQGKLTLANGLPADGDFDFLVKVFDSLQGGTSLAEGEYLAVHVVNGIFTIPLSFDPGIFSSNEFAFLDVQVRVQGGNYFQLTPRLQIGFSPYAVTADSSRSLQCSGCVSDGQIISLSGSKISGAVANATNAVTAANVSGIVGINHGGTGSSTQNFVDLITDQSVAGNKTFSGILSGNGSGLSNVPGTLKWNVVTGGNLQLQSNNGYVLTNTAASTVTLPASPNVGDVVRVMEKGSGGFTLAMNSGQSILDWATTHQETIWTRQYTLNAYPATALISAIASSNDGNRLVAVEYPGYVYTSQNGGQTWTSPMPSDVRNYTCAASSSDGSKLIVGVEGGYLYTSADWGATWTPRFTDANRNWYSVASSADGLKLIAADNAGVYTSTNGGVSWTQRRTASHLTRVASSADGTRLVAAEYLGNIYTSSTSGAIWIERYSTTGNSQWQSVASDSTGAKIAVVRNFGQILISSDFGLTWTEKTVGPSGTQTRWSSITMSADGMRIAAVGPTYAGPPSVPGTVEISYDGGNSWTLTGSGTSWLAVAMSGNGGRMAASMADPPQSKLYSGPVATTTIVDSITGPKDSAVELVYIGNNQFAMVSSSGNIALTPQTY